MANFTLLLLALLAYTSSTQGLNCYHCMHVEGLDADSEEVPSDSSCKSGSSPKKSLSQDCDGLLYTPIATNKYIGVPKDAEHLFPDAKNSSLLLSKSGVNQAEYILSCYKLSFDGKLLLAGTNAKATLRSCLAVLNGNGASLPNVCYAGTKATINREIQEVVLQRLVAANAAIFDDSTDIGVCNCNADECNGAIGSVSITDTLIAISTLFSQISKYL